MTTDSDRYATATDGPPPSTVEGRPLVRIAHLIEQDGRLDGAVDALRPLAAALADSRARPLLLGRQLGHAVHPLLTDAPLGAWMSALTLDVVGGAGARPAARRLMGLGLLAAVPTAVTGLAEWSHTQERDSRVGVVHAASNSVALTFFAASYLARRREHHGRGVALGMVGGLLASAGGFLGAHLAIARNVSSRDSTIAAPSTRPADPESLSGDARATAPLTDA